MSQSNLIREQKTRWFKYRLYIYICIYICISRSYPALGLQSGHEMVQLHRSAELTSLDLTGPVLGVDPYVYMYHMYIHTYLVEALTCNQFVRLNLKLHDRICHLGSSPAKG